jgi:hypothetical protein
VITDTSPLVGGLASAVGEGSQQSGLSAFLGGAIPTARALMSQGGIGMLPFYEIMNFHDLKVDLSRPLDENILNIGGRDFTEIPGIVGQVGRNFGKNISLVGEPLYVALTGQDPSTGKPVNTEGAAGFIDYMMGFIGQTQLLKNLGVYTPLSEREENSPSNFRTEDDRLIGLRNFFTNSKLTAPNDPQNIKNAQRERNARLRELEKRIEKRIQEERVKPNDN